MRKYILAATLAVAALTGCASDRDNRILTGAAVGGVIGNVLGNGSTGATVGGAVVGGAIGAHTSDHRDDRYRDNRTRAQRIYDDCRARGYSHWQCTR